MCPDARYTDARRTAMTRCTAERKRCLYAPGGSVGAGALVLVLIGDLRAAMGDRKPFTGDEGMLILLLGTPFVVTESEPLSPSEEVCAFSSYASPGVAAMSSELPELTEGDISSYQQGFSSRNDREERNVRA